jgi:hypothetical protein
MRAAPGRCGWLRCFRSRVNLCTPLLPTHTIVLPHAPCIKPLRNQTNQPTQQAYADDGHHQHQHPHHHHHPHHHQAGPPGGVEDVYARQGYPVQGPNGWVLYRAQDTGDVYYHNHNTGATQWERPAEWPSAP